MKAPPARLLCFLLLLFVVSCSRREEGPPPAPTPNRPNVLLITIDTTRADRLGCYGHTAANTPHLDSLATGGVRFDRAYAQVPLTLPSHTSLLTGAYPPETGLRINGGGRLGDDIPTIATVLKAKGYRTGAFVAAAVLSASFGLDRGFDHYDDNLPNDSSLSGPVAERPGNLVCDAALAWLAESPDRLFFAWVHLFDAHHPYEPPQPYQAKCADPYDGEIAFADAQLGRLLDWLNAEGLRERTLVVVVGDHGEAFGEHEEKQHGLFVYDSTMRVPLLMSQPARLPAGRVVTPVVQLVDVVPTVFDLIGLETPSEASGQSLVAAVNSTEPITGRSAYAETQYPYMCFGWAPLASLTTDRWKYIEAPRPELYDIQADPAETRNVIANYPDDARKLSSQLTRMISEMRFREAQAADLDADSVRQLQTLGYVGGAAQEGLDDPKNVRDPKDMVVVYLGLMRARHALQQHQYGDVVAMLEPLVSQSPESDVLYAPLGAAYLQLKRFEDARIAYEQSLRRVPNAPENLCGLGDALGGLGQLDQAALQYERALGYWPTFGQAHSRLGLIRARQGRHADALEHFRKFAELSPSSPNAHSNLANALMAMNKPAEAAEHLQTALKLSPNYAPAHRLYWQALLAAHREGEAVAALRQACAAMPRDAMLGARLAWLLAVNPKLGGTPEEAVRLAEAAARIQPTNATVLDALGAAYANAGRYDDAARVSQQAIDLAEASGNTRLTVQIRNRLQHYQQGLPYRQ